MRHLYLAFCCLGAIATAAFADLTVHLQSPFGAAEIIPHLVLNSGTPDVAATSSTVMKGGSENWGLFKFKKNLSGF